MIVADESLDAQIVERLRRDGHNVLYIAEVAPGDADEDVLGRANAEGALLVTADKDFGELVYRRQLAHHGVVLIRLAGLTPHDKAETAAAVVREHATELAGSFTVVAKTGIRIRRKP